MMSRRLRCSQMIPREDDNILYGSVLNILKEPGILSNCISRPLEPLLVCWRLCGSQHLHKPISSKPHTTAKVVRPRQVSIEGGTVELSQNIDLADARVDAIAHGNVYEPINTSNGHSRLGPGLCQGVQSRPCSPSKDHSCKTRESTSSSLASCETHCHPAQSRSIESGLQKRYLVPAR